MTRNRCKGWANGDPVSFPKPDGAVRAVGKVVIRKSQRGTWYCKVELKSVASGLGQYGAWVWPEGWVIGQGPYAGTCLDCGQAFRSEASSDSFCLACNRRFSAEVAADSGIRKPLAYLHGARTPSPPSRENTPEELAAIAAEKARDEQESIF